MNFEKFKLIAKESLPDSVANWLGKIWHKYMVCRPALGKANLGDLRRLTPICGDFGFSRGMPIDRYYIEKFIAQNSKDIYGHVLEIGDSQYTRQFGSDRVIKSDVLHVKEGNPEATIIGDLTNASHIPSNTYDCVVITQTLHIIFDMRSALQTICRILKPGGTALMTFPGISQIAGDEWKEYWCWSLTTRSAQQLYEEFFPTACLEIEAFGNMLSTIAFLSGLATEDLKQKELDYHDPLYEALITVKAIKPKEIE